MNPMTARAKRLDNGEWVVGYPVHDEEWAKTYMFYPSKEKNEIYITLKRVEVDRDTLNYETGKLDCNKKMIYGGMEVNVHRFAFKDCIYKVMFCNIKLSWILIDGSYWLYLCQFESKDLKIMGEKEG